MGELTKKIKDTLKGAKDTVTGDDSDETRTSSVRDPLTEYESSEPMTPAKIKEHEPTAVKREMTEKITEPEQVGTTPEEASRKGKKKWYDKGNCRCGRDGVMNTNRVQLELTNNLSFFLRIGIYLY